MFQPLVILPRLHSPLPRGSEEGPAFSRGIHERRLRLVVDDAGIISQRYTDVLLGVRNHELLEVLTTTDLGPSVVRVDRDGMTDDYIPVTVTDPHGSTTTSDVWPASTWLGLAEESACRRGRHPDGEVARFLLAGAMSGRVDALVLEDPDFGPGITRDTNAMSVAQATALVGLFFRSRNSGVEESAGRRSSSVAVGTQRFIVVRCLLSAGWRWWSACVAAGTDVERIGQGLQIRLERALRARDEVMIDCLQHTRGRGIDREILYHFDAMLLWLGGAIDTTALVAKRALSLSVDDHNVGWRRKPWRDVLATAAPELHTMTEPGTPLRALIDLIATFRNTIHGEPVTGVTYGAGGDELGLVQLPVAAERDALTACEVLGGKELWGFVREGCAPIGGLWDPYTFVQVVLPFVASALNVLMDATPVDSLPGVDVAKLAQARPTTHFFEPARVRRLMALNGVRDPEGLRT